jgi:beta-galactosidase
MRNITTFNTDWKFHKTDSIPTEYPQDWESITLPHTWNAIDGQDGGNDYWRGTACYVKEFACPCFEKDGHVYLEFKGAAYTAEVYLNGKKLMHHENGFSTFRVEITDALQEKNLLAVTINNAENDHVYPQKADFTFYGGIYRDVNLITTSSAHFELIKDGTPGMKVTPLIDGDNAYVTIKTWSTEADKVCMHIAGQDVEASVVDGHSEAIITIPHVHLWNGVKDPYLYTVTADLIKYDQVYDQISTRFGCRSFSVDACRGFFLNGQSYPLRGVSRHQDRLGVGNAISYEMMKEDMEVVKELGANTIRLAHYQHAQEFYDLCDETGIVVWAEIPYITRHMPHGRENTLTMMRELITQCYNHPSIVCWGLSNEITASGSADEDLMENHRLLNNLAHELDKTRLTTMAHVFMLETSSPLINIPDIGSYNLYYGWYLGDTPENGEFFDQYHKEHPDRVIGFSEYGADMNLDLHSSHPERGDYSEEYGCIYHEALLKCIEERPYLWATHLWNLFDFAADGRDEGGKHGRNQKGLVCFDHKTKKDPFYLYKAAWSTEPFVHLCGSRYVDRCEAETEIKVYSNQKDVTLYVDGKEVSSVTADKVFTWKIALTGEHTIMAVSGACKDEMRIRKADVPNPSYSLSQGESITNWFDKDDFKEGFYSIKDTLGALMAEPKTAPIIQQIMAKASESRGDVAKSTMGNEMLQKMMAKMSLQELLKQAGEKAVPKEAVMQLNAMLQKIEK